MAKKSVIPDGAYTQESPLLNISQTVGRDGINLHDDVYLVQSLLREVLEYFSHATFAYPTGLFTESTNQQLEAFKLYLKKRHDKCFFEGHIDPVKDSIFAFGSRHTWAIVKLNSYLIDKLAINGIETDRVEYMIGKYPKLADMLK